MTGNDVAQDAVATDLASARFQAGVKRRQWRVVSYDFPILIVAVAAIEPDGCQSEYFFRFELTGFPVIAPDVRIWDCASNTLLAPSKRPKGSARAIEAFKPWGNQTVYRPWDRYSGAHNNWVRDHPSLSWHPKRDLAFILEDLNGLLTSNATASCKRSAA